MQSGASPPVSTQIFVGCIAVRGSRFSFDPPHLQEEKEEPAAQEMSSPGTTWLVSGFLPRRAAF